jgi:ribosome biogenesis GTPase
MKLTDETLEDLGWKPFFSEQISPEEALQCHPVRVMAVHRGQIAVSGAGVQFVIAVYSRRRPSDDHPTVGDWLLIDNATLEPVRVLRRMNLFKRRAPGDRRRDQMIAANIDTLFIVASCNQDFSVARLERYLVLAREVGVDPVVVLTKTDLTDTSEAFAAAARAIEPGLRVETVNGRDPASVARLAAWCGKGETVALLGSSGVGKSTLVNTLRGSDSIATQAIRAHDDTGRHTTTVRDDAPPRSGRLAARHAGHARTAIVRCGRGNIGGVRRLRAGGTGLPLLGLRAWPRARLRRPGGDCRRVR